MKNKIKKRHVCTGCSATGSCHTMNINEDCPCSNCLTKMIDQCFCYKWEEWIKET